MHHCVGSYSQTVLKGNCYIYKVLNPQRATLELVRQAKSWRIGQLALHCNNSPSQATRLAVQDWLLAGPGKPVG